MKLLFEAKRCYLVDVDLNMVRSGVVKHPSEWKWSGYHEIHPPKERYRLIDHEASQKLLHVDFHHWIQSPPVHPGCCFQPV